MSTSSKYELTNFHGGPIHDLYFPQYRPIAFDFADIQPLGHKLCQLAQINKAFLPKGFPHSKTETLGMPVAYGFVQSGIVFLSHRIGTVSILLLPNSDIMLLQTQDIVHL